MAVLSNSRLTLADVSKLTSPDGKVADVAEMLSQSQHILEDIIYVEGNQATSHVETIETGLPDVYFRAYNQGVPTSKSTTVQITEPMAMLEARSYVDTKLLELNGNSMAVRFREDSRFARAMGQRMMNTIFNGNVGVDAKSFTGLATRYSDTTAGNGRNIIKAGGVGADNASMYLICWDEDTVFCTYPKGSKAGLSYKNLGEEAIKDANGNEFQAMRSLFQWDMGLVVKNHGYVVRICNIDTDDFVNVTGTQALTASTNLLKLMMRAIARLPMENMGRCAFYCNRTIQEGLMIQGMEKSNSVLAVQPALTQFGKTINQLSFLGYPIRTVDGLSIAETLVA